MVSRYAMHYANGEECRPACARTFSPLPIAFLPLFFSFLVREGKEEKGTKHTSLISNVRKEGKKESSETHI